MRIKVVYLGGSFTRTKLREEDLDLEPGANVQQLSNRLAELYPDLASLLASSRFSRNFEFAEMSESLHDGDEIGVLPPVSGGSTQAQLTDAAIDIQEVARSVMHAGAGATVLFVGTSRQDGTLKDIEYIDYEAYQPMAERQLDRIARAVCAEHPGAQVRIVHRIGKVPVSHISVVIAASAPHRLQAFEACQMALESIKQYS